MPQKRFPRHGSLQFWPRKRASSMRARRRFWPAGKTRLLGFSGYKVGMRHVMVKDDRKNSLTKGETIAWPVTILECPPLKVAGAVYYKSVLGGLQQVSTVLSSDLDKFARRVINPKSVNSKPEIINLEQISDVRLLVHTQPSLIDLKKTPEFFELGIGGSVQEKDSFAKEKLGKVLDVSEFLSKGSIVDIHGVTKGKGLQGPMRRFGGRLRHHKSEKSRRTPGSLGPWNSDRQWTVAKAGQHGFHLRTEFNKIVLDVKTPESMALSSGYQGYGNPAATCLLVKGSIMGPAKRLISLTHASRPGKNVSEGLVVSHVA